MQHKTAGDGAQTPASNGVRDRGRKLKGTVEVDGAYFGGHIRPANLKDNRIDRRLAENQTGKRRVVVVARERKGRTMTTVTKAEADGVAFVDKVVAAGSVIQADEASHWDALHAKFQTYRINHQIGYSLDGACTNQAESFLARLRRMVEGQHHHVSPQYLHQYASHAAWMEDHRRIDNGALASRAWAGADASGQSELEGILAARASWLVATLGVLGNGRTLATNMPASAGTRRTMLRIKTRASD